MSTIEVETDLDTLTKLHILPLIELNDQINTLTASESTINSARIVVAGDQSHGKTSLLEALGGIDLPRGEGIQTRVPLVLQLRGLGPEEDDHDNNKQREDYAQIKIASSNTKPERISLSEVGDKVNEYTINAAGKGKDICDEPIELKVYRKGQVDLTLIDLPGITRVALKDQAGGDGKKLEELIMKMCERYMKHEESINLNVVSAMVDFSTSASLQLSRKLDQHGDRTMLCVTKVDQHMDDGLVNKIEVATEAMGLRPGHVFAVRNRSQLQNNDGMPLSEVRKLEAFDLKKLTTESSAPPSFGLGIPALSRKLVKIQHQQILKTLPETRKAIEKQISSLQGQLSRLGEPVGGPDECKVKASQLIDSCMNRMQNEMEGRMIEKSALIEDTLEGDAFEISVEMDDFIAMQKKYVSKSFRKIIYSKGFSFELENSFTKNGDNENAGNKEECLSLSAYITPKCTLADTEVKSLILEISLCAKNQNEILMERSLSKDYSTIQRGWGWSSFLPSDKVKQIKGPVTIIATIFVKKLEMKRNLKRKRCDEEHFMLCANLVSLQEKLVNDVNSLYSNEYFFSAAFRKFLSHKVSVCRGSVGLPGVISHNIPVNVLKILSEKLPTVVSKYRENVAAACIDKINKVVECCISKSQYPRFHDLVISECVKVFEKQSLLLIDHHKLILEWEGSVASSNHYFMDTVNSVRKSLSDSSENRPSYLKNLSDSTIAAMSNEDQRLVDMQIEIFVYWKLMKKRFIDYIVMSTVSGMVDKPIRNLLKPALLKLVFSHDDDSLVNLFSSDEVIVHKRTNLAFRLGKLSKARDLIDEHQHLDFKSFIEVSV